MSDQSNTPQSQPLDCVQRLKASLEADTEDTSAAPSLPIDDDLAALLRAQIARGAETAGAEAKREEEPEHNTENGFEPEKPAPVPQTAGRPSTEDSPQIDTETPVPADAANSGQPDDTDEALDFVTAAAPAALLASDYSPASSEAIPPVESLSESEAAPAAEPQSLPPVPDAGLNPPDAPTGVGYMTNSDSRLESLREKNIALLDELMAAEQGGEPADQQSEPPFDVVLSAQVLREAEGERIGGEMPTGTVTRLEPLPSEPGAPQSAPNDGNPPEERPKDGHSVFSPRPAEIRDPDPLMADTVLDGEAFCAPLQTAFPENDSIYATTQDMPLSEVQAPTPKSDDSRKTPRVSRMFGVYRIAESPVTGRSRPADAQKRAFDISAATPKTDYTTGMTAPASHERAVQDAAVADSLGYTPSALSEAERRHRDDARLFAHSTADPTPRRETTPVKGRHEYADPAQTSVIRGAYRRAIGRQPILFLLAIASAVLLTLVDVLPHVTAMGSRLTALSATALYPLLELAILALVAVPFIPRLYRGMISLFDFEPTRYALPAVALTVAFLHALLACFVSIWPEEGQGSMPLFGSVAVFMLGIAVLSEFFATLGEQAAFSVISEAENTYVLTAEETPASAAYADTVKDDPVAKKRRVLTGVRVRRITDYFARTSRYNGYMGRLNYILPAALLVAILMAGASIILGGHPYYDGVRIFTSTYLACLPCGYILSMSLPLLIANRRLSKHGETILGTAAPTDFVSKHHTTVILPDGALLSYEKCRELPLRDDPRADAYATLTAQLLRLLDMPGTTSPVPMADGRQVQICERGEDYLRVHLIMDRATEGVPKPGEVRSYAVEVMLGSHEALVRRGVRLPKRSMEGDYLGLRPADESTDGTPREGTVTGRADAASAANISAEEPPSEVAASETAAEDSIPVSAPTERVLYLAFDRRFRRLIASALRADEAVMAEKRLSEQGDALVLSTYDPLLKTDQAMPLCTVRPTFVDSARTPRSGALVATGRAADLVDTYLTACRLRLIYRIAHLLSWLRLAAVAAAAALLVIFEQYGLFSGNTVLLGQLSGSAIIAAVCLIVLTTRRDRNREKQSPPTSEAARQCHAPSQASTPDEPTPPAGGESSDGKPSDTGKATPTTTTSEKESST